MVHFGDLSSKFHVLILVLKSCFYHVLCITMIVSLLISCCLFAFPLSNETLDLREYSSTPNRFEEVEKLVLCRKPKVVILTKAKLSEEDIARFEALVNRNDMKGTKLVGTGGEQIGSLITNWHTYNLQKEAAGEQPLVI